MARKVIMPKLAMGMSEGTISEWKYSDGQFVEKGEILLVIETEKVSYEIEAIVSGYLKILIPAGKVMPVETILGYLAADENELASIQSNNVEEAAPGVEAYAEEILQTEPAPVDNRKGDGRVIASPLAKKLAKQKGIDLANISGTGHRGRIEKKDVLDAETFYKESTVPPSSSSSKDVSEEAVEVDFKGGVKATVPVRGMRKVISESMKASLDNSAQLSFSAELDATEIIRLRERLVAKENNIGVRVSVFDILVFILARAIKKVPIVNATMVGSEIKVWEDVNLGIAIATEINEYESGLYAPVLRQADSKSLFDISREIKELSTKTRSGQLKMDDMQGGTVTISSVSFVPALFASTPILNKDEALLIQPGTIKEKPVVINGEVVARSMITISFTFDHRVVDGIFFGKLLDYIRSYMEDPDLLL